MAWVEVCYIGFGMCRMCMCCCMNTGSGRIGKCLVINFEWIPSSFQKVLPIQIRHHSIIRSDTILLPSKYRTSLVGDHCIKFWESGVPIWDSSSRRITNLCNLRLIVGQAKKMMVRGRSIRPQSKYWITFSHFQVINRVFIRVIWV